MNKVILTGRLTAAPELKYTQSGKAYVKFNLAVQDDFNKEKTDFINCVAWEKRAETITEYMRKGSKILIEGKITTGSYEKDGVKIKTTDILIEKFEFLDSKKKEVKEENNDSLKENENKNDDEFPF